ncbi:hypothetical protein [Thermococcus pacificus]|uniref:Uncharacterized protein n=1 Tax=Thermococcus pacificus TaxID=71998 RepID=A0A218P534_9EURY|nr:hypothetical protein [Thermococcus pacificus]ASJ05870.1 hypothetical protein A3L08_00230 [Thermococcus pacificus]
MNEILIISALFLVCGLLLGIFIAKTILKDIGIPPDERALELDKLTALRTLELIMQGRCEVSP